MRSEPSSEPSACPLDRGTAGLLVDALHDQSWDVRIAGLRAVTRLSLEASLWQEIGEQARAALALPSAGGAPADCRLEYISQAARIPVWEVRLRVRELQEDGNNEESRTAAWALVNVRDSAAVPFLVHLITAAAGNPDPERQRQTYARHLATLDVSGDSNAVGRLARFDADENVRFWSSLALARSGDTAVLEDLLEFVRRGDLDVNSVVWSPEIRRILPTLLRSDHVGAEALKDLTPERNQPPSFTERAREVGIRAYELEEEISRRWWIIAEVTDIWPAEYGRAESPRHLAELAAALTPVAIGALVSSLFEKLIERAGDETWRFVMGGNAIVSLAEALDGRVAPDLPGLLDSYSVVFDDYIQLDDPWPTLRWQIAWVASRAAIRDIVEEAVWRLSGTEERSRVIAARFIEEAVRYKRQSDAPVFGGGLEPPDIEAPAIEPRGPMTIADTRVDGPDDSGRDRHVSRSGRIPDGAVAMARIDPKAYKRALKRAAKEAARVRALASPERGLVDCTVFAPAEPARGSFILVQAYLHAAEHAESAAALAIEFDVNTSRRGVRGLEVPIPTGTLVDVELEMPGLRVFDSLQRVAWRDRPEAASFSVWIPGEHPIGPTPGLVVVHRDGVPVGRIRFQIVVQPKRRRWRQTHRLCDGEDAIRFRSAFISYASADRGEVLPRAQVLTAAGISYFHDVLDLDPGERWKLEIYKRIDECDLFLLFWSKAAKESRWVRREARRALQHQAAHHSCLPEIRPVILPPPPVELPWPELAHLHFNDRLISVRVDRID